MIQDYQTNKVYLAEGLKNYMPMYMNLLEALSAEDISVSTIPRTKSAKHVWVRDYMPIQLSKDKFLNYLYYPDYLKDEQDYIPDFPSIVKDMHLDCVVSNIVLDGGNVVKCGNKVIMTDKIFQEKYGIPQEELESISFDADSGYPVVEAIKTIIKLKDSSTPDVNVYKNIKQNIFNISE